MTEFETHKALRKLTWGHQDTAISHTLSPPPQYTRIVNHESFSLGGHPGNRVKHRIKKKYVGCGIANLRFVCTNWQDAELSIGGQLVSSIASPKFANSFFITDSGNCLPFVAFHDFEIDVEQVGPGFVTLEYDIVKCVTPVCYYQFVFKTFQFGETENVGAAVNRVNLHFSNPVEKLILSLEKVTKTAPILLCTLKESEIAKEIEFTIPFTKVSDTFYVLEFGAETVNFSHVWKSEVIIHSEEKNSVDVCGITHNVIRMVSGMYGLAFPSQRT